MNASTCAISRLNRYSPNNDVSDIETNDDQSVRISAQCRKHAVNNKIVVVKMPLQLFRKCLVNHFDVRFKRNDATCTSRCNE